MIVQKNSLYNFLWGSIADGSWLVNLKKVVYTENMKKKESMEQAKKRREEIHILIENGKTYREVAELYEISPQRVHGIIKKHLELDECEYEI